MITVEISVYLKFPTEENLSEIVIFHQSSETTSLNRVVREGLLSGTRARFDAAGIRVG